MYNYAYEAELYHYGVKGMKWGVRRKQIKDAKSDRNINQIETMRTANKMMLDAKNKMAEAKYSGGRTNVRDNFINRTLDKYDANTLKKTKARNKVDYDLTELYNKYSVAKQKAKKDKTYKKTEEYKKARKEYGQSVVDRFLLGDSAYIRIHTDLNAGESARVAYGKEIAMNALDRLARD